MIGKGVQPTKTSHEFCVTGENVKEIGTNNLEGVSDDDVDGGTDL